MDTQSFETTAPVQAIETQQEIAELATGLVEAIRDAVEAQWRALGALPADGEELPEAVIDPEALLLATLWLVVRDPSLTRPVHDWLARWSDLLSVQRTRNIAKSYSDATQLELRSVALTAFHRGKDFRWSPVIAVQPEHVADAVPHDTITAQPTADTSRLPVERAALLVLRFRMAFGVGARADALAYLLGRGTEWSTVTEIAQATGYTTSAIRRALDRMAEAAIVLTVEDGSAQFRCDAAQWAPLLGTDRDFAAWRYWLQYFTFAATVVEWAESTSRRKLTSYAITEALRGLARGFRPSDDRDDIRRWESALRDGSSLGEIVAAVRGVGEELRT